MQRSSNRGGFSFHPGRQICVLAPFRILRFRLCLTSSSVDPPEKSVLPVHILQVDYNRIGTQATLIPLVLVTTMVRRHHQPLCARAHASGQTLMEVQQVSTSNTPVLQPANCTLKASRHDLPVLA